MRKLAAAFIATTLAAAACAQAPAQAPSQLPAGAPKLLVVISVDQFSADLFDEYRPQFSGGLARIASGAAFHNGYQSHAATETCPGHSTILTGNHPAHTGIIGNVWIDQTVNRSDTTVYCAEDERVPGSSSTNYTVSPVHLMVPTLGELMKRAYPGSRNVAVSGKDRAAVMMTGHVADQRWYWTGQRFDTDLKSAPVPNSVAKVNGAIAAALAQPRPPLDPTPFCQAKAREIPVPGGSKPVGTGRLARNANDPAALRASPELDGDTLALAAALVDEMQLGRRADPDLLAISLSATDYVGHTYGTEGEEMCLQLLELDREIGDFLSVLDARGIDYSVALTADHGGLDIPERLRIAGVKDAQRIGPELSGGRMGLALAKKLGLPGFGLLGDGSSGDMYIDRKLPPRDRKRLWPLTGPIRWSRRSSPERRLRRRPCRQAIPSTGASFSVRGQAIIPGVRATSSCSSRKRSRLSSIPADSLRPTAAPGITTGACRSSSGAREWRRHRPMFRPTRSTSCRRWPRRSDFLSRPGRWMAHV